MDSLRDGYHVLENQYVEAAIVCIIILSIILVLRIFYYRQLQRDRNDLGAYHVAAQHDSVLDFTGTASAEQLRQSLESRSVQIEAIRSELNRGAHSVGIVPMHLPLPPVMERAVAVKEEDYVDGEGGLLAHCDIPRRSYGATAHYLN